MGSFQHIRHRPPVCLPEPRGLLLAVSPLRSAVNLSRMVRLAGCCGIQRVIHCGGNVKIDPNIARDAIDFVQIENRRSLLPVLTKLKSSGFQLIGLEQTTNSKCLYGYRFARQTALVIGSEREGLSQSALDVLDDVVEIPVYGPPASYNVVTATTMACYEYCRQFPES